MYIQIQCSGPLTSLTQKFKSKSAGYPRLRLPEIPPVSFPWTNFCIGGTEIFRLASFGVSHVYESPLGPYKYSKYCTGWWDKDSRANVSRDGERRDGEMVCSCLLLNPVTETVFCSHIPKCHFSAVSLEGDFFENRDERLLFSLPPFKGDHVSLETATASCHLRSTLS